MWARAAKFDITEPVRADYMGRIKERPAFGRTFKRG
jgi:hypothetical protein